MSTVPEHTSKVYTVIEYGSSPEQFYEWYAPTRAADTKGLIVLVHGGFWRQMHTLDQMHALARYFVAQGWAVANIEYRRADCGGDWPAILEDVNSAFSAARAYAADQGVSGPVVGVGHSVGGQLVLLAAQHQDVVIALAPVTDVVRTYNEGLGEHAAAAFFKDRIDEVAAAASPIQQNFVGRHLLVVHGDADQRVPLAHSMDFVHYAKARAARVDCWQIADLDHFHIIDPDCTIWSTVQEYLAN